MPTHTDFQPFLVTLTIGSPYIPPRAMPTLDALLWGAARLESPQCEDVAERIPLKRTDGVFHGSCMMCDPMFPDCEVKFFQSINNERKEDGLPDAWLDGKIYEGLPVDISKIRGGDAARGTFSTKRDGYVPFSRGRFWNVGFYGCGDMLRAGLLLRRLPGIGRKASRGYGAITNMDVVAVDQDLSLMRDGLPMRPIPGTLWKRMGGSPLPLKMARAELRDADPNSCEVNCVAPAGEILSW